MVYLADGRNKGIGLDKIKKLWYNISVNKK